MRESVSLLLWVVRRSPHLLLQVHLSVFLELLLFLLRAIQVLRSVLQRGCRACAGLSTLAQRYWTSGLVRMCRSHTVLGTGEGARHGGIRVVVIHVTRKVRSLL